MRLPTSPAFVLVLSALLLAPGAARAAQPPPQPCAVSTDPDYARTAEKPAQVGGSPVFGGARQRRYLESLRGPEGQAVRFTRLPAVDAPDGETLIDRYEITYDGLDTPVILFLDWYRYTALTAPRGFVCGQPFNLGLPPPDPFLAADQLQRLALADGGEPAGSAPPIELGGGGPNMPGVAFDHFRLLERASRAAAEAGTPLVAGEMPEAVSRPHSVVLAYPRACDGRQVPASRIVFEDPRGRQIPPEATGTRLDTLARWVPAFKPPEGTLAARFALDGPRAGVVVKATYPDACSGATEEITLELSSTPARLVDSPMPTRPAGDGAIGVWVAVQAVVDQQGRFREATALGGPADLARAAVAALAGWRAEPPRVNGAPLTSPVVVQLTFQAAP